MNEHKYIRMVYNFGFTTKCLLCSLLMIMYPFSIPIYGAVGCNMPLLLVGIRAWTYAKRVELSHTLQGLLRDLFLTGASQLHELWDPFLTRDSQLHDCEIPFLLGIVNYMRSKIPFLLGLVNYMNCVNLSY